MHISLWCEGSVGKRTLFWPVLTKPVGHLCCRAAWNPCLWVWEPWEQGSGHRAPLSLWVTDQNLHTVRENRFKLSPWISIPAGNTLSFTPADRLMVTLNPAVPQPTSGLDSILWSQLENRGRSVSLLYRNAVSQESPLLTDCNFFRKQWLNKWKMSHTSLSTDLLQSRRDW